MEIRKSLELSKSALDNLHLPDYHIDTISISYRPIALFCFNLLFWSSVGLGSGQHRGFSGIAYKAT